MTADNHTLFAAHVALDTLVDMEGDRLDCLERRRTAGHRIDEASYTQIEDGWWAQYQRRKLLDEAVLSMQITADWQISYKAAIIHRTVDFEPERRDELWGQHSFQVESWALRCA